MNYQLLFQKAKDKGIEDIQIYQTNNGNFDITVFNGELEKYAISDSSRLKIKGLYNGKMGTVNTEINNDDMIDFIVDGIIASANAIDSEDEVFIYEGDDHYKEVEGLYNDSLETVDAKEKINATLNLEKQVKSIDKRIQMVQAFYGEATTNVLLKNSKGLTLEKKVNSGVYGVYAIASDGTDQRTGVEYIQSNDYNDFDFEKIAKEASKTALDMLGAKAIPSGEYEVVLKNTASAALLAAHGSMFSAESVQKDVSLLKDKVGDKIASSNITLVDDPFKKASTKSGAFDDEGVATKYKEIIDSGNLTGYLHNLKTAKKDNTESTGNGFNNGISTTNFYFKPGELAYDDAVKSMKKGLVITDLQGTHAGTDAVSGDFSLQALGYLVEDGKITRPVALITAAGNYLDLLKDVTDVCDDLKFNFGFIGSPSLKIKKLSISGD